jgi:hypothetical protein
MASQDELKTCIVKFKPDEYERLRKVSKKLRRPITDMIREALRVRYLNDLKDCADHLNGYVPPPTDEDLKWVAFRHKQLMNKLHKDIRSKLKAIDAAVQPMMKHKRLTAKDMERQQTLEEVRRRPRAHETIKEWNAETQRILENPVGSNLARRYLYLLRNIARWLRHNNCVKELAQHFPSPCLPSRYHGFNHYGTAVVYYLFKLDDALSRWYKNPLKERVIVLPENCEEKTGIPGYKSE